jgi:putative methyltransferase (TIGR04325 family)
MNRLRWWVKALTPPIVLLGLRKLFPKREPPPEPEPAEPPEWEYVPEGWRRPVPGWNAAGVLAAYEAKWPAFVRALEGSGPLGVNHEAPLEEIGRDEDIAAHNLVVSFAYVLALAEGGRDRVSLLDWGGGVGHYFAIARAVLPAAEIDYTCRDLPLLCARGRELFPDATFSEDDSCLDRRYDLVLASSSLHYSDDWRSTLAGLGRATGGHLYVTRVPLALRSPSFVVLQRAQRHGYGTEYLGWVLNRDELLDAARESGLRLVREFLLDARFAAEDAPETPTGHRGFLFRPYTDSP